LTGFAISGPRNSGAKCGRLRPIGRPLGEYPARTSPSVSSVNTSTRRSKPSTRATRLARRATPQRTRGRVDESDARGVERAVAPTVLGRGTDHRGWSRTRDCTARDTARRGRVRGAGSAVPVERHSGLAPAPRLGVPLPWTAFHGRNARSRPVHLMPGRKPASGYRSALRVSVQKSFDMRRAD